MPVTLQQIADQTGLSKPTVKRILGKDGHLFHPDTRRKVLETAKRLGYRPNAAAKAVGSGVFGCAALLMGYSAGRSDLPINLLIGIQEELAAHDMHLALERLPDERLTDESLVPKVLRQNMADGLLINYTHDIPARMHELIKASNAPAIWLNTDLPADCVRPDDYAASRRLAEYVLSRGHRRVLYAKFDDASHYSTEARRAGYETVMNEAGLSPRSISRDVPAGEQVELVRSILQSPDRPTAVICRPEDASIFTTLAAASGLRFPEDLSLASIAGRAYVCAARRITSVVVPAAEEGRAGVRLMLQKIARPEVELPPAIVPFEWDEGDSVARI